MMCHNVQLYGLNVEIKSHQGGCFPPYVVFKFLIELTVCVSSCYFLHECHTHRHTHTQCGDRLVSLCYIS